jgi:ornithine carbamoyltransferase
VFEKPSARTRSSMELAVVQLGGHPVSVRGDEVGIDRRETAEDVARTLACYHAAIGARTYSHRVLERMAAVSPVPVVNLLSDDAHPLQALADLLTLRQAWGGFEGRALAWVGDGNNVCRSLGLAGALAGLEVRVACPPGYGLPEAHADRLKALEADVAVTSRPEEAVAGADAVYTDVWASMGQEDEAGDRRRAFEGFGVDDRLMAAAAPGALFLHCLPAHRGEEVTAAVFDGPASRVWAQAANRMHAARGVLRFLVEAA